MIPADAVGEEVSEETLELSELEGEDELGVFVGRCEDCARSTCGTGWEFTAVDSADVGSGVSAACAILGLDVITDDKVRSSVSK